MKELHDLLPENDQEFYNSLEKRRAIERQLQICIEAVVDIAFLLLKLLQFGPPQNEGNIFDLLDDYLTNTENLKAMKGFRNILVHQYGKVDQNRVLQFTKENLDDFYTFVGDVKGILDDKESNSEETQHS